MRNLIIALIVSAPFVASALDVPIPSIQVPNFESGSEGSGTVTVTNSGGIRSNTSSSANTGGNSVGSGGKVQTGAASASSHSEVNVEGGKGTVEIHVETEVNGVKKSESVKKDIKAGESININVSTSSSSGKVNVQGWDPKSKQENATSSSDAASSTQADSEGNNESEGFLMSIFQKVSLKMRAFASIFSFWR